MLLKKTIFIFLIIGLFLQGCSRKNETKTNSEQIAQDFVLENLSGKKVSLKDLRGKTVLLNFFATWCSYCIKEEIPVLINLNKKYKNSGLVILGIDIQEKKDKVLKLVDKKKVDYTVLLDSDGKVANLYNVFGIPTNVLIDKNGIVQYYGNLLPDENLIKSFLPEELNLQVKVGKKIPDFTLLDIENKKISLYDYFKRKLPVIVWFTNSCGDYQSNIPDLETLYKKYKKSIEILAITQPGNDKKTLQKVITKLKPTFPFLIDPEGKVCKLYTGEYVPNICPLNNIYFIDKNGILRDISHYPGLSKEELDKKIKTLISGK